MNDTAKPPFYLQCSAIQVPKLFSPDECQKIINLAHNKPLQPAQTDNPGYEKQVAEDVRKSDLQWLPPDSESEWIYDRMYRAAMDVNNDFYGFDIKILEHLQYLEYQAGHFFKPHFDIGSESTIHRKITVSIQLSDPGDYQDGELRIYDLNGPAVASKGIGDAIFFPPYLRHEALEITSGNRKCLIGWFRGEKTFV